MRLIDADALREEVEFHVTSVSVCGTAAQAQGMADFKRICLEDIDNAPTIDAILVEWLRAKQRADYGMLDVIPEAIEYLLIAWQMERNRQNGNGEGAGREA